MSISLNKLEIIGNLGADPEMKFTPNGTPTTKFNVAVSRTFASGEDKTERKKDTEWFTVVTWGKLAETCNQHLKKGVRVFAAGRCHLNKWEDTAGQKHARLELVADTILFLDRKTEQPVAQVEIEAEAGSENIEEAQG
jgi:single-strand DNA-binding protein